jgi:hypothetical protein
VHKSDNQRRLISRLGLGSLVSLGLGSWGWGQSPLLAEVGAERLMEVPGIERAAEIPIEIPVEIPTQIPGEIPVEIPIEIPVEVPAQIPGEIAAENPENPVPEWENSPVFQRWQQQIPNVLADIENDPSFRTRWRLGYGESNHRGGLNVGVEDIFLVDRLTLSGDYQIHDQAQNQTNTTAYGAELRYYLLPLGNYVNVSPVLGYRQINTENFTTNGVRVGGRVQIVLSRPSAADLALSQTWVAPSSSQEVAITDISLGYAITHNLRVGTQWQLQQRGQGSDRRLGIFVEFY